MTVTRKPLDTAEPRPDGWDRFETAVRIASKRSQTSLKLHSNRTQKAQETPV
jgi:hypothetical protein